MANYNIIFRILRVRRTGTRPVLWCNLIAWPPPPTSKYTDSTIYDRTNNKNRKRNESY